MTTESKKINVAIVGGGMGGLALAIGLLKLPHLSIQIYEAAHEFSEIGAGIGLGPNAQRALELIEPKAQAGYARLATSNGLEELRDIMFEYGFATEAKDGQIAAVSRSEIGQSTIHRAKFLGELVEFIPEGVAHFGKRLEGLDDPDDGSPLTLHFKDGTTATADCLVGADGIHSVVREYLLGKEHPALHPKFTGYVAYRGLVPMKDAIASMGERRARSPTIWMGYDGMVMSYPIDSGETVNLVALKAGYEHWEGPWVQKTDFTKIQEEFAGFGSNAQNIIRLLDIPDASRWSLWDHPAAPFYNKGRVAMMGDAAHASTPFQGQGAGQAIEDAYVLSSMMAAIDSLDKIPFALKAFDAVRRPRSQKVCKTSLEAGDICCLRMPGIGDDAQALKEDLEWRFDWIWHRDIALERTEALKILEKLLAKN